jgi:hypothetical protein
LAQFLLMKVPGYWWLAARAGVTALAEWDLVRKEIGERMGGVASGAMGLTGVQECVRCAIEVGASTLGAEGRMNLSFGCAIGAATVGVHVGAKV